MTPAFSGQFRERLSRGKYTQWATDLSVDNLEALLWMVGEFGLRAVEFIRGPSDFDVRIGLQAFPEFIPEDRAANVRMKAALTTITSIVFGLKTDRDGIRRIIHEALDSLRAPHPPDAPAKPDSAT